MPSAPERENEIKVKEERYQRNHMTRVEANKLTTRNRSV